MRSTLIATCFAIAAGCGSQSPASPAPAGPESNPAQPSPAEATEAASTPTASEAPAQQRRLWTASADLDGDGVAEALSLESNSVSNVVGEIDTDPRLNVKFTDCKIDGAGRCLGVLRVGRGWAELNLQGGYFGGVGITVVDVDTKDARKELLIAQRGGDGEDPPYSFWLATYDGSRLVVHPLWGSSGYNSGTVKVDGSGSFTVHYDECPDAFTLVYELRGMDLHKGTLQTVRQQDPGQCAACPYVFAKSGSGWRLQGEILRNLNRPALAQSQSLALLQPGRIEVVSGVVTLQLRETKPETTYLDAIALQVGQRRIAPMGCRPELAHCTADGRFTRLLQGETLELRFAVGAAPLPSADVQVLATGYYVPHLAQLSLGDPGTAQGHAEPLTPPATLQLGTGIGTDLRAGRPAAN